jgi:hypothetical protein
VIPGTIALFSLTLEPNLCSNCQWAVLILKGYKRNTHRRMTSTLFWNYFSCVETH